MVRGTKVSTGQRIFKPSVTHSPTEDMGVKLNISLLLSLASLAAATSPQEDMSEGRLLFSNYTSGETTS